MLYCHLLRHATTQEGHVYTKEDLFSRRAFLFSPQSIYVSNYSDPFLCIFIQMLTFPSSLRNILSLIYKGPFFTLKICVYVQQSLGIFHRSICFIVLKC